MWILDIFASAGFGALLGGLFGWLNKREERATLNDKQSHQVAMLNAKTNAQLQLADKAVEASKVKGELLVDKEEAKAFTASQKTTSFGEAIKSLFRPLITCALLYVSYELVMKIDLLVGGLDSLPVKDLLALYKIVILQIFGLTGICVGWWFSTRTSKGYDKLIDKHL
jgi:hypothetical protein